MIVVDVVLIGFQLLCVGLIIHQGFELKRLKSLKLIPNSKLDVANDVLVDTTKSYINLAMIGNLAVLCFSVPQLFSGLFLLRYHDSFYNFVIQQCFLFIAFNQFYKWRYTHQLRAELEHLRPLKERDVVDQNLLGRINLLRTAVKDRDLYFMISAVILLVSFNIV